MYDNLLIQLQNIKKWENNKKQLILFLHKTHDWSKLYLTFSMVVCKLVWRLGPCWFLVPNLEEMSDFFYPHEVKDQIFPNSLCLFVCFLSMFIIPFLKVISELRYFCFNAFYNVTVLHYNSILWEELLRNKKKNLLCGQTVHSQTGSVSVCLRVTLTKEILRSYSNPKVKENIYI